MKKNIKLDVLAFGAHPDDVDACAGGLVAKSVKQGLKVGIIDLTVGDNSENGSGSIRAQEAQEAAKILELSVRENLNMSERGLEPSVKNENLIVQKIRQYRPDVVVIPHWHDRHRGHRDASILIERAIQSAKYSKILPELKAHKVKIVLFYMIHYEFEPNFIFDISDTHQTKMRALYCHKSQLFSKDKKGNYTKKLLDPDFMEAWISRSRWLGYISGVKYGEAYAMRRPTGINSLNSLTNLFR